MTARRRLRLLLAALAALALAAFLTGCGGSSDEPADPSSVATAGPTPVGTGTSGVDALRVGACLTSGSSLAYDWSAPVVDCATPHTVEVFGVLELSGSLAQASYESITKDASPQRAAFAAATQQYCTAELNVFASGKALLPADAAADASVVPYFYGSVNSEPVPASRWNNGDKRVVCYATFGAHAVDEGILKATGDFLATFWLAPASNLDVRSCQATADSVSCAAPHDREYLGQYFAQDFAARAGFDAKTLAAFNSGKATQEQWRPYDALCQQLFAPLISPAGRADVAVVAATDTTATYWGLDGSYAMQCVASPVSGFVNGSLLGIGSAPLPVAAAPAPTKS